MKRRHKHTAGPWYYSSGAVWSDAYEADFGGTQIAKRGADPTNPNATPIRPTEKDANMRLCAAAPEILNALESLLELEHVSEVYYAVKRQVGIEPFQTARAAISKAVGQGD
ncbi:MAG: hypothetical protein GX621_08720 [Pirellulaceae bacterium]|nr:hypothetical protein [Pirellulaceae bacterium]